MRLRPAPPRTFSSPACSSSCSTCSGLEQLAQVRALFDGGAADRALALVECCWADWPQDLADHIQREHADGPGGGWISGDMAAGLDLRDAAGPRPLWDALVRASGADADPDAEGRPAQVRAWLGRPGLNCLSVLLDIERHGWSLPGLIRHAHRDLHALGPLQPGARVLVLLAVARTGPRPPLWWT